MTSVLNSNIPFKICIVFCAYVHIIVVAVKEITRTNFGYERKIFFRLQSQKLNISKSEDYAL